MIYILSQVIYSRYYTNTITNSITLTNTKVNNDLFCYFYAVIKISNCKGLKFL